MKLKMLFGLFLSLLTLAMFGCGGSGGGGGGSTVNLTALAGPISGGTAKVFQIYSSHDPAKARINPTPIAQGTINSGKLSIGIPDNIKTGGLLVTLTGGTYKDEATGATRNLADQAANGLSAVFGNISGAVKRGPIKVSVTPFTTLGVADLGVTTLSGVPTAGGTALSDVNIAAANAKVATTLGLGFDIVLTAPFDPTAAPPAGVTQYQRDYALSLGTLSQLQRDKGQTIDQIGTLLLPDVNAGALSAANQAATQAALLNFANSGSNQSGGTIAPVTVAVTPATAATAKVGTNVTVTATVQQSGSNVADGTQVAFAIKSGAGGTLSALSATTTGGIASITLTSTTDAAAYVVTATAGGVAADTATISFANPNKPGNVVLTAAPTSGVINGQSPVTLTAAVTPVDTVNGVLPTGTVVTFNIVTGTGGAITAVTTTNASGFATATLNSTAVGTIRVSATAGTAPVVPSNNVDVPFISQPTLATVKVTTTGTLPVGTRIGGANFIVTANPSAGLTIADADVTATGAAATGVLPQPNTTNVASINLAMISTAGFLTGECATLVYHIAPGTFPTAADFTVALTGAGIINTSSVNIPGIGVSILSVNIQ